MAKDEFFEQSGFSADYIGVVSEGWFGVNPTYNPSMVRYFAKFKLDEPIQRNDGGVITEVTEEWNAGSTTDWQTLDGGKTLTRVDGNETRALPGNAQYAQLIKRLLADFGLRDALVERGLKKGNPYRGDLLDGLRFHIETEEKPYSFKDRETGEQRKGVTSNQWPTEYLGGQDALPLTQATAAKNGAVDLSFVDPAILQVLKNTAQSCATYAQFLDAALKIEGVADNDKLVDVIANESTYTQLAAV